MISHPDAGWESLKNRLIEDLASQGRILPIQARVVFKGLIELPYLSIGPYKRKGGIEGLEAAYIEDAVRSAAGAAGLSQARTLDALLTLVDDINPELPKSRTEKPDTLLATAQIDQARGGRMLNVLEQNGVVRPRVGDATEGAAWWSLYHDYLAKAVLSAHRHANRWQRLLQDKRRDFRTAANWQARWHALLSPWEQVQLIGPTLRRRVRWGGYYSFGLVSGVRFLPIVAMSVLTLIGGDWYLDNQAVKEADRILTGIRGGVTNDLPLLEEYRELWILASANPRLKRTFVKRSVEDRRSHPALIKRLKPVARALFGLDPEAKLRTWTLELLLPANRASDADHPTHTIFRARLAAWVYASRPHRSEEKATDIARLVVEAMVATTDADQLRSLGEALGALGEQLPGPQAEAVAKQLVQAMAVTTDSRKFIVLAKALGSLHPKADPQALDTAPDLLQAPMAYDGTLEHLLRYYSHLANQEFKTTDAFVAWARTNHPNLDLSRQPRNPFR